MKNPFADSFLEVLQDQDFFLVNNIEDFKKHYPEKKYGEYRPQPTSEPASFPCLCRQELIYEDSNGADHVVLSYIYPTEKTNTKMDYEK